MGDLGKFLYVIAAIAVYEFIKFLLNNAIKLKESFKLSLKSHRAYKEKMEEINEMKSRGEMHEWVDIEGTLICKKTGYVPSKKGFVNKTLIDIYLKSRDNENKFQEYRKTKLKEIAEKHKLPHIDAIYEDICNMKKEYHVNKMQDFLDETRKN